MGANQKTLPLWVQGPSARLHDPAEAGQVLAGCYRMRARTTMSDMAVVYRRPVGVMRQSVKPQLASSSGRPIPAG